MATSSTEPTSGQNVVIVGAGFAGVACAKELAKHDVAVTLIDKNTYHQFQPLLYQVATAQLAATDVLRPLRGLFRKHPTVVVKTASIDPESRTVTTAARDEFTGDYLVLAAGSTPNFFGITGAEENSYPLYSGTDATRLRNRVLQLFEDADLDPSRVELGALNFVIIGGGPTGVETAGSLADLVFDVMVERYHDHDLDVNRARIILIDRADVVLRPFSESAHKYAAKVLTDKGVELILGVSVSEVHEDKVALADGTEIQTHCVVWAGGLKTRAFEGLDTLPTGRGGRISVGDDLSVDGHSNVYAIGDTANTLGPDGKPLPQLASVAVQAGKAAGANIAARIADDPVEAFEYHDKGIMAMIGKRAAIAEIGSKHHELHGLIAFSAWLGVHAWLMSTTRARVDAFISWAWDSFTHNRGPAIIDDPDMARIDWTHGGETPDHPETDETSETSETTGAL